AHRLGRILRPPARAEVDPRARALAQLEVARQEVGVEVREQDVPDRGAELGRLLDVDPDVAARVDDHGRPRALVEDQIGSLRETAEIDLFEVHASAPDGAVILEPTIGGTRGTREPSERCPRQAGSPRGVPPSYPCGSAAIFHAPPETRPGHGA